MASSSSLEIEPAAARADRRQQPARRMADEEEELLAGGSSSILSSALAPTLSRSSTRVDDHHAPRRQRRASCDTNSPKLADLVDADVAGEVAGLLVHQPLEPAHVGMAAGLDQLDDRMIVAASRGPAGRTAARRRRRARAAPRHGRSSPCRRPWARRAARHDAACAIAQALANCSTALVLADDHGSRSARASSRRCGDLVRRARRVDQPDPLRLLGGDQAEGQRRPCDDSRRRGRRSGRCRRRRAPGPARRLRRASAPGCGRGNRRRCRRR